MSRSGLCVVFAVAQMGGVSHARIFHANDLQTSRTPTLSIELQTLNEYLDGSQITLIGDYWLSTDMSTVASESFGNNQADDPSQIHPIESPNANLLDCGRSSTSDIMGGSEFTNPTMLTDE